MAGKRKLQSEVFAHMAGSGDLLPHPNGLHIYTGGADAAIRVFSHAGNFTLVEQLHNHHTLPIRALALSASGDALASSSDDHLVQLFTIPPSSSADSAQPKFDSTLYRSTGATHSLCYHPGGLEMAMGCADGIVRVISLLDPSNIRELKGQHGAIRFLAYDPSGELLASIDHLGVLMITRPHDRSTQLIEPWMGRMDVTKSSMMAKLAWSPDGEHLALPGKRDVTIRAKADNWKHGGAEERHLKGGHANDVSICQWSGSGRYLLSASSERVVVWEVDSAEVVSQLDVDASCNSVHWSVQENSIVMLDENGYIKKWSDPVPQHMPPPFHQSDSAVEQAMEQDEAAVDTETLDPFTTTIEEEDDEDAAPQPKAKPAEPDSTQRRKRLRRAGEVAAADAPLEDFDDSDMDSFIVDDTDGRYKDTEDDYLSRKARHSLTSSAHTQPAFQPSSTPADPTTNRRYLAFNLIGSIVSHQGAAFNSLEIVFSDSAKHKPVRLRDHYGFSMAALGEHGCVMASRWESSTKLSVVFYRAFDSWAANSDWTLHLPSPETALSVAVGGKVVAVGTDKQFVRLLSYSGVQLAMWSTRGPIVSLLAHGSLLCTVYHSGMPLPSHQSLHVHVMDTQRKATLTDCPLPISPGATLTWLGYSEKGLLLSMDSSSIVRCLSAEWGGQWIPLLDASQHGKDIYWPVGLIEDKLMCAVCKGGLKVPNTLNRPVLTAVELKMPFVLTDTCTQEEQHARTELLQYQAHHNAHLVNAASALPLPAFQHKPSPREQAALDKQLIPLFQLAVSQDQGHRAVDIASRLYLLKSMEICYTLANQSRRVALASRVGLLMGARRKEKEEEKEREKGGAAISISGFMEKGERRAEEDRRQRMERLRREEEALNKRKITVVDEEDEEAADEGETELTYTKNGKKRVKTIEKSDVQAAKESRDREAAQEKDELERKKKERQQREHEQELLVEDEAEVVEETSRGGVDFLTAFRRAKEQKDKQKEKRAESSKDDKPNDEDEQPKRDNKPSTKSHAPESRKAKQPAKRKEKGKAKDCSRAKAVDRDEREKENAAAHMDKEEPHEVEAVKPKPKPANPFAKRTFA